MIKDIKLIIIELVLVVIVSVLLRDVVKILKFSLIFVFMYFLPLVPWIKEKNIIERLTYINILSLGLIPITYMAFGTITRLNSAIYIIAPILVFTAGIVYNKKTKNFK